METENYNQIKKTPVTFVLITLCTCKRPLMLKECLLSVNSLEIPDGIRAEVLVVDNDKNKSAEPVIKELQNSLKLKLHYVIEPNRGISNARNKQLTEAIKLGASHILMFDDDELLTEKTLINHVEFYSNNENVIISSGPTPCKFDNSYPSYIKKHFVFKQKTTKKTGLIRNTCASGNVFFPVSLVRDFGLRFSDEYVYMGGEDGDFFKKASDKGFTIAWNNDAVIYEVIPKARANINYILNKCYYNGYSSSYCKFKNNKKKSLTYLLKTFMIMTCIILGLIPSILLGLAVFFNMLGLLFKTKGKIDGAVMNKPLNFYEHIYGE